ncbi:transmembrane channel-like protein isoform X1 [Spodoptera frugiperda]|uniref:Transmembrane channel-like protein isoform X1 n=2 Tax=Spodoptera frugiperda TaxID=7108 RepID=A0A9R0D2C7_SPOFR|nr:transmembrane channel-like protein isoform X1 [Spodoptera frugiperda]XP_035437808.1 transmembrane channel-like protein isoform X1 [Spodoptera frugiperda]
MSSSGVNLFHLPSETPVSNEVKFSPTTGDGSEDEDYSASLSAVLRQRRASVRRSRKGRARRPSSPFLADENRPRRRSSVFTTSSGDTAISMDDGQLAVVTQEQIFENIHLHKEVLGSVKQQPLGMRRKLKIVHQAKAYIKRHEGQLQERLAQSKSTRDIYARFNILLNSYWQQIKREAANTSNLLIPWELRIKEIESHFGSVVASYFTFLRWLFWVNLVIGFILLVFVIVPEYLTANPQQDGERKIIMDEEKRNASNLLTLWEFEGVLKCSPIFYGYYSNVERAQYRMPLAYFLTGLAVYIYSFVAILRKMAENSRMSKLSEKEDECIFSWKLFTGWDFMIGNTETAHNRIASVILGFKEALLEEAEKKKDLRNWRIISLRALVNICVVILLAVSAYAVVTVVSRSDDNLKVRSWWRENETTIVVTVISITFPVFFELLGFLEHYHPRKQLRLQLARIMLLNLLNLYSLIFALFSKIEGMSKDLDLLKPTLSLNATVTPNETLNLSESYTTTLPDFCIEQTVSCGPCDIQITLPMKLSDGIVLKTGSASFPKKIAPKILLRRPRDEKIETTSSGTESNFGDTESTTLDSISLGIKELERLRNIRIQQPINVINVKLNETTSDPDDYEYTFYDTESTTGTETDSDMQDYTNFIYSSTVTDFTSLDYTTTVDNYSTDTSTVTETSEMPTSIIDDNLNTDTTLNTETTFADTDFYSTFSLLETTTEILDLTTDKILDTSTNDMVDTTTYSVDTTTSLDVTESTLKYSIDNDIIETSSAYSPQQQSTKAINKAKNYSIPTEVTTEATTTTMKPKTPTTIAFCPDFTFNCTINCNGKNMKQVFFMSNCTIVKRVCYVKVCPSNVNAAVDVKNGTNATAIDVMYYDDNKRKMYNLSVPTKKKLLKLCWETMFGQELVKLTMMDLVFVLLGTLFLDFFRALFVRYMNRCWCWDLEKKFPEYGDFKIAENILHLINNQGMVWMGMFFSPGLVVLNVVKLMIMMYLRSWAVMTCNVPHEVVFRVSKSNNFYLALLLTMLFLCVLPVGYTIVWVKPSWHCGPFSEYDKIYYILTINIYKILPNSLSFALEYIASPAIVIPLLVLLILIIYYLTSLTNSLREANNDLKIQLRRERTEERRKMFQLADTRRRGGSSSIDNTPFARWKKALPSLPMSKSIDSDDRKTLTEEMNEPIKVAKKKGGIFAKIVGMALDKKSDVEADSEVNIPSPSPNNVDDETDSDFHETLPRDILKIKDIFVIKPDRKVKNSVEFKTDGSKKQKINEIFNKGLKVKLEKIEDRTEKKAVIEKQIQDAKEATTPKIVKEMSKEENNGKKIHEKQTSQSSTQSKQSDSIGSVIPVITISTTESDEEMLSNKDNNEKKIHKVKDDIKPKKPSDLKSLRRQSSVESISENKQSHDKKQDGHKYQYSL